MDTKTVRKQPRVLSREGGRSGVVYTKYNPSFYFFLKSYPVSYKTDSNHPLAICS